MIIEFGNLTRDPERYATNSGDAVAKFTIAVNDGEDTTFLNCVAFKKLADNCLLCLSKGSKVLVSGKLKINEYENEKVKYRNPEIIAYTVEFLTPKNAPKEPETTPGIDEYNSHSKQIARSQKVEQKPEVEEVNQEDLPF